MSTKSQQDRDQKKRPKSVFRRMSLIHLVSAIVFFSGSLMLGKSLYMSAKAELAQLLIASAWQQRQADQPAAKPWPWADIHAIAKIEIPRLNITQYVMNGSNGEALAFGPGHLTKTSLPANTGHSMISGHRDSHFEFLQELQIGDKIIVSNYLGKKQTYVINTAYEMDTRTDALMLYPEHHGLTLITCFPFNNLATQGPLRWIVEAVPITI